ncbi:alpha/beta hydrolase [Acinetobacter nectaris]|uniref:alpha/beta hydrolase n=1 Tax=Acinetobacter nectaris TaxID=1219382 RepID=UPI001F23EA8C|nr:alpha/beta hydrolase [Acinetobacter nectaris]MCF8999075.1 alpha/beta hydrolase [Acinetobacter nectaris]MCF9026525.1 alpha/beta hydrolase [Acinetobacter nectaris]
MTTIQNIIVPGVGGSNEHHWQSWLENRLTNCSRVQQDWQQPILNKWVEQWIKTIHALDDNASLQIIAHSFGCLTSIAALNKYPEIASRVKNLILVAPANPIRFGETGFSQNNENSYFEAFKELKLSVPTKMIISENDPWLSYADATYFAALWHVPTINLGQVGHINVDSGFGAFPELMPHLLLNSKERMFERTSSLLKSTQRQFLAQSGL